MTYDPSKPYVVEAVPDTKPTNPKDAIGSSKLPLHLWPMTASAMGAIGLLNGALKYGRANWRVTGVRLSVYLDAIDRHKSAFAEGEDVDPDDGVPHLAAILASTAIIVDAMAAGKLIDDRHYPGGYRALANELTPHVERLKKHHAGRDPKHWTIADAAVPEPVDDYITEPWREHDHDTTGPLGSCAQCQGQPAPKCLGRQPFDSRCRNRQFFGKCETCDAKCKGPLKEHCANRLAFGACAACDGGGK